MFPIAVDEGEWSALPIADILHIQPELSYKSIVSESNKTGAIICVILPELGLVVLQITAKLG